MRVSERHLAAGCSVAQRHVEVIVDTNLLEGVRFEEFPVGVAEMQTFSAKPLELSMGDQDRDRSTSPSQFNFNARFGLVDDLWKAGSGFSD